MIRVLAAIFKKELRVNFLTLSNFLLASIFVAVSGLFFFANVSDWSAVSLGLKTNPDQSLTFDHVVTGPFFMNLCLILLVMTPLLSTRAFSDEKRSGIFELLFTYPIRDIEMVVAKWAALLFQMTFLLLPTIIFFHVLKMFAAVPSLSILWIGYLGIWMIGAFALSIGIFYSAVTSSQTLALIFTFVTLLFFWTNGWLVDLFLPKFGRLMSEYWLAYHMKEFASGILETNRLLFYGLGSMLALILSMLALEFRIWRR